MADVCAVQAVDVDILSRHRKERKDLQSKIQGLKKSATKGDKKKKKQVTEEIVRLEQELEERHQEELSQLKETDVEVEDVIAPFQTLKAEDTEDDNEDLPQSNHRISKAQRRRDKRATKEKEREKLIGAQEIVNKHGPRNVETQKIKSILKERNLMIQEIASDGNCLYCAVDYQLKYTGRNELGLDKLRTLTSEFLLEHQDDFLPFLSSPETSDLLSQEQYRDYCNKVANTPAWGGEIELRALSHVLKCPIEVVQAVGPSIIAGEEYRDREHITLTYHRHMYGLGEHYNSVKAYQQSEDEGDEKPDGFELSSNEDVPTKYKESPKMTFAVEMP